ncbi:MAG: hypothetical protein ABI156_09785 [Caldimonas sp.]
MIEVNAGRGYRRCLGTLMPDLEQPERGGVSVEAPDMVIISLIR